MKKTVGLLLVSAVLVTFTACEKTMSGKPSEVNSANEMSQTDSSENAAAIERMAGISVGETDCEELSCEQCAFQASVSSPDEDGAVHSWVDLGISFDAVRKVRYVEKGIGETGTFSDPQTVKGILEKWKTLQYTEKSEPKAEDACVFEFFKNVEDITPAFIVELLPFAVTMNGKRYGPYVLENETIADDLLRQVMTER